MNESNLPPQPPKKKQ